MSFHVSTFRFALSISYSVYLSISNPGIYLCIYMFIYPSANLLASYLSTYLAIYLSMCLSFLSPCTYPSIYPAIDSFIHRFSTYLSFYVRIYLFPKAEILESTRCDTNTNPRKPPISLRNLCTPQAKLWFPNETYENHKQTIGFIAKRMKTTRKRRFSYKTNEKPSRNSKTT